MSRSFALLSYLFPSVVSLFCLQLLSWLFSYRYKILVSGVQCGDNQGYFNYTYLFVIKDLRIVDKYQVIHFTLVPLLCRWPQLLMTFLNPACCVEWYSHSLCSSLLVMILVRVFQRCDKNDIVLCLYRLAGSHFLCQRLSTVLGYFPQQARIPSSGTFPFSLSLQLFW